MKKILILFMLTLVSLAGISQITLTKDTALVDTTRGKGFFYKPKKKQSPFYGDFGVGSTNLWRGVDVGKQTGVVVDMEYEPCRWTTFGFKSYVVANQFRAGIGNQMITSAKVNIYNVSLGVQDVYFQNQVLQSDTDYFVFDKARTNHFFEATFNYKGDKNTRLDFFSSMVFYQNQNYVLAYRRCVCRGHFDHNCHALCRAVPLQDGRLVIQLIIRSQCSLIFVDFQHNRINFTQGVFALLMDSLAELIRILRTEVRTENGRRFRIRK
jgi:hypothetical protein